MDDGEKGSRIVISLPARLRVRRHVSPVARWITGVARTVRIFGTIRPPTIVNPSGRRIDLEDHMALVQGGVDSRHVALAEGVVWRLVYVPQVDAVARGGGTIDADRERAPRKLSIRRDAVEPTISRPCTELTRRFDR